MSDLDITPKIQLIITLDPTSRAVSVNGPIQDKLMCLGMIELAKAAIQSFDPSRVPTVVGATALPFRKQ
jgi:hypothetical protein